MGEEEAERPFFQASRETEAPEGSGMAPEGGEGTPLALLCIPTHAPLAESSCTPISCQALFWALETQGPQGIRTQACDSRD